MRLYLSIFFIFTVTFESFAQYHGYTPSNSGTRNYAAGINSFEYGIIGSNQDATGSPVGLVASIVRKVPRARKISDKYEKHLTDRYGGQSWKVPVSIIVSSFGLWMILISAGMFK